MHHFFHDEMCTFLSLRFVSFRNLRSDPDDMYSVMNTIWGQGYGMTIHTQHRAGMRHDMNTERRAGIRHDHVHPASGRDTASPYTSSVGLGYGMAMYTQRQAGIQHDHAHPASGRDTA